MDTEILARVARLSDQELVARVKLFAQQERDATAVLIAHLSVLDERRLYLAEGCSSLFTYCTEVLHLSENAAYGRIEAARAARKFPIILEMLANGSLNLTTVGLLASHLTPANHRELLQGARHRSKRQVEEIVAGLRPQPPVPSSIRRVPTAPPASTSSLVPEARSDSRSDGGGELTGNAPDAEAVDLLLPAGDLMPLARAAIPTRRAVVEPLAPHQYKVQFTASAEVYEKLRLAQDLLRHQIPDGDLGQIMDRALSVLLETLGRQKFAATEHARGSDMDRPRENRDRGSATEGPKGSRRTVPHSRHIPAEVKRRVWLRDGGWCAFVSGNGRHCAERGFLEFHHVAPFSVGGEATIDNIELRCRAHNGYEAELFFGRGVPLAVREACPPHWRSSTRSAVIRKPLRLRPRRMCPIRTAPGVTPSIRSDVMKAPRLQTPNLAVEDTARSVERRRSEDGVDVLQAMEQVRASP